MFGEIGDVFIGNIRVLRDIYKVFGIGVDFCGFVIWVIDKIGMEDLRLFEYVVVLNVLVLFFSELFEDFEFVKYCGLLLVFLLVFIFVLLLIKFLW